jgi:pilus assembly protein CpaE
MVIDEAIPSRAEVRALLARAGYGVAAESGYGIEAVSLFEEKQPALVLVSVEEPLTRAFQTIESIHSRAPGVPIVAYSSQTDVATLRQAMRAGVRDFLPQPLKLPALASALMPLASVGAAGVFDEAGAKPAGPAAGVVIAVLGAKGGIGKSTIATNLAATLASRGEDSVLIIDLDTRFGDVAIMMDLEPRHTVSDVAAQIARLDRDAFMAGLLRHSSGAFVLPSAKNPTQWKTITTDQVRQLVAFAQRLFDYVILDTPGAFNELVATAIEIASQVLLVTSVDLASIKDTAFVLDVLQREGFPTDRLLVTVNHANGANTVTGAQVEKVLHHPVFWELPHDSSITRAAQVGQPVVLESPKSDAARSFAGLATKLGGPAPAARGGRPLFKRVWPRSTEKGA